MTPCRWCSRPFPPMKRGGNEKIFCKPKCKSDFETAARRYALAMVDAGLLSVSELKRVGASNAPSSSRAGAGEALEA